ncbi:MAG: NADH-ubiquinone oxidoreductase chain [Myxococcaceae bacterium]|nr:NADH-ubiquinone oxidoreductase chain [Myxococcaceae bacterium]
MDSGGLIGTILKIVFILIIILTFAPVLIWAERRQSAMIQDRIGPTRADIKIFGKSITLLGLLHPLADALKFVWKEDFVPPRADKLMHSLAPIIALVPSIAVFAVIPFGGQLFLDHLWDVLPQGEAFSGASTTLQVANVNIGILYVFAIAGTGVVGAAIAGYSSDSKYALLGGVRAAGQMVSYEVALGLSLVGCFMVYDSLLIGDMINFQRKAVEWLPFNTSLWGIAYQPLAFFLYFTAAIAESKRIPFDIPEGESELAAGYFTEYSGMKFGMFFMGEFVEVISSSGLLIALFLGGYDLPFLEDYGFDFFGLVIGVPHVAVIALQVVTFIIKLVIIIWLQLMIRWSLPRFRYDQLMQLCWKLLLPLSLLNILVTGAVILFLDKL